MEGARNKVRDDKTEAQLEDELFEHDWSFEENDKTESDGKEYRMPANLMEYSEIRLWMHKPPGKQARLIDNGIERPFMAATAASTSFTTRTVHGNDCCTDCSWQRRLHRLRHRACVARISLFVIFQSKLQPK